MGEATIIGRGVGRSAPTCPRMQIAFSTDLSAEARSRVKPRSSDEVYTFGADLPTGTNEATIIRRGVGHSALTNLQIPNHRRGHDHRTRRTACSADLLAEGTAG